MLRKSILLAALVGSAATAAPTKPGTQSSPMTVDESLLSMDPIAERDHERGVEARWFLVGVDRESMYMIDRRTLQRQGAVRTGWAMVIQFAAGKVLMRAAIHDNWDCSHRTETKLMMQTYDGNGTPDPIQAVPPRAEPIVPDTLGEDAFNFVCDRAANGDVFPMPLSRDPVSATQILAAYADGSEVTILGLLLATLDPRKDEERLQSLLKLVSSEKQPKLTRLIWSGMR